MFNNNETIYNINNLTDEQIYNILGVSPNIEDHILESLIKSKITQYKTIDEELSLFFDDIYNYFFFEPLEDENPTIKEGFTENNIPPPPLPIPPLSNNQQPNQQVALLQQTVQYKADNNLNPLLKETITKTITINSFDRDNKNDSSTNFTMTLSESLNNIVSLKLYSVQIPYTWYSINTNVGSNYFVLQGIAPGIDDGLHNIFIDISSGNYTPTTLTSTIQTALLTAENIYSDISFGTTSINYNESTALTTLNFDIQKRYNETDYYLAFPSNGWTNPNGALKNYSLAGFLGFNYINYFAFSLLSNQTELRVSTETAVNDNTLSIYYIDNTNNFITIVQYVPKIPVNGEFNYTNYQAYINSNTQDPTTQYIKTITIPFSLATQRYYTRTELFENMATQIAITTSLDSTMSKLIRVNNDNSDYINFGFSYFQLMLKLNRYTTQTYEDQKCSLIFPPEITGKTPIWVGSNSCFHYDISVNEVNNIYSETPSYIDTFTLLTTPFIAFVCVKEGYDVSTNNYYLPIDSLVLNTPITFTQYQTAINTAFTTAQNASITSFNSSGDFNITNTYIGLNNDSNAQFSIDINKNMTIEKYYMDISNNGNFLFDILDISYNGDHILPIDLSNNNIFYSTFSLTGGGYSPFLNGQLASFYLKPNFVGTPPRPPTFIIDASSGTTYQTINELQTGINALFATYQDPDGQNVLSGSNLSLTINNNSTVSSILQIKIDKILTQNDYKIVLSDVSNNNPLNVINYTETTDLSYNQTTWYNDLFFQDISYNNGFIPLNDFRSNTTSYTTFAGSIAIGNTIFTPYNNTDVYKQFFIVPQSAGLTDPTNSNIISYTLLYDSYTKSQLIQEINSFFDTNIFTSGSYIEIVESNSTTYTKIRLNIDKTFKAYDYNLVFYSPYNTTQCNQYNSNKFTTWDTCLGWVLGFKAQTEYLLSDHWNYSTQSAQLTSDSVLSIFLYNSFIIVLDDYTNNHLNDGLVTISKRSQNYQNNTIPTQYESIIQPVVSTTQNYGLNQELNAQTPAQNIYSPGIYLKDVFGIIPMDTSTLRNNDIFVQIASTLQDQNRIYFGPVNIYRMGISLYTDRGQVINLNGADWSFQLIAEQLYSPTK